MRARIPEPTHLKLLKGTRKERINWNEPRPKNKRPLCPRWLSPKAKKYWRKTAPEMHRLGLLAELDVVGYAIICQLYAHILECTEVIGAEGTVYQTETGFLRPRPEIKLVQDLMKQYLDFGREYGLTPASRSRISVEPPDAVGEEDLD